MTPKEIVRWLNQYNREIAEWEPVRLSAVIHEFIEEFCEQEEK